MAGKITKKELKKPDFLQVEAGMFLSFCTRHKSKIYILLASLFVFILIGAGWTLYKINYEKSAIAVYNQVGKIASSSGQSGDAQKFIDVYRKVISEYPRSQAALHALYQLGNLYLSLNQVDFSLKAYDEFLAKSSKNDELKVFAYTGMAYCHEIKKDFNKALSYLEIALKIPDSQVFQGQIYRDMARIYEEQKVPKKSLEYYRKSLEKTTNQTMQAIIKRKIASLS